MIKYTEDELLSNLWQGSDKGGSIEARKAIDLNNLILSCERDKTGITLKKSLVGLTSNEEQFSFSFTKYGNDLILSHVKVFGQEQDPIVISKVELDTVISEFKADFKSFSNKTKNYTSKM